MTERTIVIFHDKNDMNDNVNKLLEDFVKFNISDKIIVFSDNSSADFNKTIDNKTITNVNWPIDCNSIPKLKNWINKWLKTQQTSGIVHVINDTINLKKDPTVFIDQLEHMMKALDYPFWMNTTSDPCNYLYKKYIGRLVIDIDNDNYKAGYGDQLIFTSHSNDNWIAYDFDKINDDLLRFDEDFTIPMYYIIEILARRKALRRPHLPCYMNQYMTVASEKDVFEVLKTESKQTDQNKMKEEDQLFRSKNIAYASDNNIDLVLEDTYETMKMNLK